MGKCNEAKAELKRVLNEQKTVQTSKLKVLLNSMNVSLKNTESKTDNEEVAFLKGIIKRKNQDLEAYRAKIGSQKNEIQTLKRRLTERVK